MPATPPYFPPETYNGHVARYKTDASGNVIGFIKPNSNDEVVEGLGGTDSSDYVSGLYGDGVTDDLSTIQDALNDCGTSGGGAVHLPVGVFLCSNVLSIPSNVVLVGCGGDASIIINPAGAMPGKTIDGFSTYATIAMIGVSFSGVVGLGIDHLTNGALCNGIQIGAVAGHTKNCFVKYCKINGFDSDQYMIWNYRADDVVISGNTVIGNMAPDSENDLNGIEVYGGHNIEISSNTIRSVGVGGAILVWEDETLGSLTDVSNIRILNNEIDGGVNGVSFTAKTSTGGILIFGNTVYNQTRCAIHLSQSATAISEGIIVAGNSISNVDSAGIDVNGTVNAILLISGNTISGITGEFGAGINIVSASGISVSNNYVTESAGYSCVINSATDCSVIGNVFDGAARHGVMVYNGSARIVVRDNRIQGYATTEGYGVIAAGDRLHILNNLFKHGHATEVYAVYCTATNAIISSNIIDYASTFSAPVFSTGSGSKTNYFKGAADSNSNVLGGEFDGRVNIDAKYANTDVSPFSVSQIWYNAGVAFSGIRLAISEGLSSESSKILQVIGGASGETPYLTIKKGGNTGIGVSSPTAALHLKACTAVANTASLKIDQGVLATTPVSGNIESDGTHLYWTDSGGVRRQLDA